MRTELREGRLNDWDFVCSGVGVELNCWLWFAFVVPSSGLTLDSLIRSASCEFMAPTGILGSNFGLISAAHVFSSAHIFLKSSIVHNGSSGGSTARYPP